MSAPRPSLGSLRRRTSFRRSRSRRIWLRLEASRNVATASLVTSISSTPDKARKVRHCCSVKPAACAGKAGSGASPPRAHGATPLAANAKTGEAAGSRYGAPRRRYCPSLPRRTKLDVSATCLRPPELIHRSAPRNANRRGAFVLPTCAGAYGPNPTGAKALLVGVDASGRTAFPLFNPAFNRATVVTGQSRLHPPAPRSRP